MKNSLHARPRYWLELGASLLLAYGIYSQRNMLGRSLSALGNAALLPVLLCFSLTWLLFLLSATSYRLLASRQLSLRQIMLAHLAAAGPGRILPGGAGQMSIGTLYLTKKGMTLPQAIAVAVGNNIIGCITNVLLLAVVYVKDPHLLDSLHFSGRSMLVLIVLCSFVAAIVVIARRNKSIRKNTNGTSKVLRHVFQRLRKQPVTAISVIAIMLATTLTNSLMLYFAAHSVDVPISLGASIIAMSTGVAIGGLIPTPGGIGGVEAGLVASLYALGFQLEAATSAALLYRFATYILPFVPGIGAYIYLRQRKLL